MFDIRDSLRLTGPERILIEAAKRDTVADLRGYADGEQPMIRAQVLQELCTGKRQWKVKDCIRMIGGRVRGRLDLSDAHLTHELHFTDCIFEDTIDLRRARAEKPVEWVGREGRIGAAILADGFESDTNLTIADLTVTGVISLHWANVRGDLRLSNSHLAPPGGQALRGTDLRVGGTLFLNGQDFHAKGEVCLQSAHIGGQVDCRHAHFDNTSGHSIRADHLIVNGEFLCEEGFHADGEVCLQWAQVQRLRASGSRFASNTAYALHADALCARAGVYLDRKFHATATVRLVGAYITGELCCTQGFFDNPSGCALDAERIEVEDVYLDRGFIAHGEVRFTDAQVRRQLNATNGEFHNERVGDYALDADGLDCSGEVYLNEGFHAIGAVSLTGAKIAGELNCTRGSFTNSDGHALFADGLTTPGFVYLDRGFRAIGEVRLARATVGRQLVCTDGVFDNQHGTAIDITGLICKGDVLLNKAGDGSDGFRATGEIRMQDAKITRDLDFSGGKLHGDEGLNARGMQVGGCLTWVLDPPPEGCIDLTGAQISRLKDTKESWPPNRYTLTGLGLQSSTDSRVPVDQRIDWLGKTTEYSPAAYQQLVQMYRRGGQESDAAEIAIASQRDRRQRGHLHRYSKAWNWFLEISVGYGYRLHRPFLVGLALWIIGWVLYILAQHAELIYATGLHTNPVSASSSCPKDYPCFYPGPYAFQLLIPGLDLREATQWLPNAGQKPPWGLLMLIWTWVMIVFGWVATTAVVAGVSRIFRRR